MKSIRRQRATSKEWKKNAVIRVSSGSGSTVSFTVSGKTAKSSTPVTFVVSDVGGSIAPASKAITSNGVTLTVQHERLGRKKNHGKKGKRR